MSFRASIRGRTPPKEVSHTNKCETYKRVKEEVEDGHNREVQERRPTVQPMIEKGDPILGCDLPWSGEPKNGNDEDSQEWRDRFRPNVRQQKKTRPNEIKLPCKAHGASEVRFHSLRPHAHDPVWVESLTRLAQLFPQGFSGKYFAVSIGCPECSWSLFILRS